MAAKINSAETLVEDYERLCLDIKVLDEENVLLKQHLTAALHTIETLRKERLADVQAMDQAVREASKKKDNNSVTYGTMLFLFAALFIAMGIVVWLSK